MGVKENLLFGFTVISTLAIVMLDVFICVTVYNSMGTLVPMIGNNVSMVAVLKNIMYMFAVAFVNMAVIAINLFLFVYKFRTYELMSEEEDELA